MIITSSISNCAWIHYRVRRLVYTSQSIYVSFWTRKQCDHDDDDEVARMNFDASARGEIYSSVKLAQAQHPRILDVNAFAANVHF